ncbi:MAG: hypothetical protein ACRDN0_08465 [Trebonia sp.]
MDTFSDLPVPVRGVPNTSAMVVAMRNDIPYELGQLPFQEGALITRSIWVTYVGELGPWTHAVMPVDNQIGMPDPKDIASLSGLVANAVNPVYYRTVEDEALVVLRRPGPRAVSDADRHIFRLIREAIAERDPVPWSFHVATPNGAQELMPDGETWPDVPSPW